MTELSRPDWHLHQETLANGLRVVFHRDTSVPLVAVNLWYHVGSKNERPGRTGFAHLFEHMLFQGSQNVGTNDHFRYVQQVGGVANGSTSYDRTNYFETLPAHCLELGLWLESDRLGFLLPAMTAEKLENQREVVMNERRQRVDNQPYGRAFERLQELVFAEPHPYHWPVIGYMDDIAAAGLTDVEAFFRAYYVPSNAVLTLAGDFEIDRALELVERFFGPISAGAAVEPIEMPAAPERAARSETLEDRVELTRIYMGFRAPPITRPEWYAGDLLASVLTGGKSSPMYQDLVYDRQLAQDVSALVLPTELDSTWILVATARPEVPADRLEAALGEHLERAASGPLPADELERARNRFLTSLFDELQSLDQRADLLSRFATYYGDANRIEVEIAQYLELGANQLTEYAASYLAADNRVVLRVVPGAGPS